MSHVSAEYNGDHLTSAQIELLYADLQAELDDFAAMDAEPEPEAEILSGRCSLTPLSRGRALESSPLAGFVSPSVHKHPTRGRALESSPRAGLVSPAMTRRSCTDEHYQ